MPFGAAVQDGAVRFALWAPAARSVDVALERETLALTPHGDGWFNVIVPGCRGGARYRFIIDQTMAVPDPASRFQPEGVHGPSEVIDPTAYQWCDDAWAATLWHELVFYELHVGAFTPQGTYRAAIEKLDLLVDLGITAVELMPLGESAGARGWGYDGVYPFAPESRYGRPEDLKAFVEAAHRKGLAVFLDVVYNHFGPEGNYLSRYAPQFFTDRHRTPWGTAIDFEGAPEVRRYFLDNALYWTLEFGFDGLRLDAVHAMFDGPRREMLDEIGTTLIAAGKATRDGRAYVVLENDGNSVRLLQRFAAQWDDDVHHPLHLLLTHEADGYYADYLSAPAGLLARALTEGFAYQGERSLFRGGMVRGEPSNALQPASFVTFLQNHDQIGNRAFGERIGQLVPLERVSAAAALLLLAPSLPLLFMGEEWAASSPFLFFCDFEPELARRVRDGRRAEFASFSEFSQAHARERIPDPCSVDTFERSRLDWSERDFEPHRSMLRCYTELLSLRRKAIVPLVATERTDASFFTVPHAPAFTATWSFAGGASLSVWANLGDEPVDVSGTSQPALQAPPLYRANAAAWRLGSPLPPWSVIWYRQT